MSQAKPPKSQYKIGQVAALLGVSTDTVRRWTESSELATRRTEGGHRLIDGKDLARFMAKTAKPAEPEQVVAQSARNRFPGIVTRVIKDKVMAQVDIQAGQHRVVSLMSREAADQLELEPGKMVVASIKATNVVVDLPEISQRSETQDSE